MLKFLFLEIFKSQNVCNINRLWGTRGSAECKWRQPTHYGSHSRIQYVLRALFHRLFISSSSFSHLLTAWVGSFIFFLFDFLEIQHGVFHLDNFWRQSDFHTHKALLNSFQPVFWKVSRGAGSAMDSRTKLCNCFSGQSPPEISKEEARAGTSSSTWLWELCRHDGEAAFGWEGCWAFSGPLEWTHTWDESIHGNWSEFLCRSEGAS